MKRLVCLLFAAMLLSGMARAYTGDTIVYVTNSGSKYHMAGCSYLKSANSLTLADAVSRGYSPCSRCNPPILDGYTAPEPNLTPKRNQTSGGSTAAESMDRVARDAALRSALEAVEQAQREKQDAEVRAEVAEQKLDALKHQLFVSGVAAMLFAIPGFNIWVKSWKERERKRIELDVRASMPIYSPPSLIQETEPKAEPLFEGGEKRMPSSPLDSGSEENPYLKEAYRQLYEGKSLYELTGAPKNSGICFDSQGYPHRKNPLKVDEFTVYITKKGKSYHTADCPNGRKGHPVNICAAKEKGLGPCERCCPMGGLPDWVEEYRRIFWICKAFGIDVLP